MSNRNAGGAPRVKKVMTQPAHLIYEYLKNVSQKQNFVHAVSSYDMI